MKWLVFNHQTLEWLDFPSRIFYVHKSYATQFDTYEDAQEAADVMEARGWKRLSVKGLRAPATGVYRPSATEVERSESQGDRIAMFRNEY